MKVLVLGATGGTGRLITREALAKGHKVVALVRSREKARDLSGVELIEGDARDSAVLNRALVGCAGAISSLGTSISPFKEVTLLSKATEALVKAMDVRQVRRLVCITGVGAGDSRGHGGFFYDAIFYPLLLRKVYADKDRQEAVVRSSNLNWILVRPTILNDKPAKGSVRATTDMSEIHGGAISRADVAGFVVAQLENDTWVGRTPLITW